MAEISKSVRVLNIERPNSAPKMLEDQSGLLFWDDIQNQAWYPLIQSMREAFWIPDDISMAADANDWQDPVTMSEEDKTLFLEAIGVLASLDSVATMFDAITLQYIKDSAIRAIFAYIAATESIHNESYTYALSSVVSRKEALQAFEEPKVNPMLISRNELIMKQFNDFLEEPTKENLPKALVSMTGLEGLCFVNGFTPFYFFNRDRKMFSTGSIIRYIQKDEAMHLQAITMTIRDLLTQYSELNTKEFAEWVYAFFTELVDREKKFCDHLYRNHPEIDIYEVKQYIEYRANVILELLGLTKIFDTIENPMEWIKAFDPENIDSVKTDFFEDREVNYSRATETTNQWDDL